MTLPVLVALVVSAASPAGAAARVTVDDLMRVRVMSDVRISPDGERVAYVVAEASLERNAYEPTLYVVPWTGGPPVRLTHTTRIFNRPVPMPRLRWSPDGTLLSFLAFVGDRPQVVAMRTDGGEPRVLTSAQDGVSAYEWTAARWRTSRRSPSLRTRNGVAKSRRS
jgi:Tol biopolymer transport system component